MIASVVESSVKAYSLIFAFAAVGGVMWISYLASAKLTGGRVHGSAIAIALGLIAAYIGGRVTGGSKGVADISLLAGFGIMGGAMFRDFAIVSTAFGADLATLRRVGVAGAISVIVGVVVSLVAGGAVAAAFGYRDAVSIATIGAGAATYIVGPVTGAALGAGSDVIALSIAAGLIKAIVVMIGTPVWASRIGLNNPGSAIVYGGLMGTTSGVAAGLAATDPKLAPYGAMSATFYTGVGCLLAPSIFFLIVRSLVGG